MPRFFDRYIHLVDNIPLLEALEKYGPEEIFSERGRYEALGERVYAPGKWTVKDILQHCIDTERIMAYRALRFARNDSTALPGFDENLFADNTRAGARTLEDLMEEFSLIRKANIYQFRNFSSDMLQRSGISNETEISALALGFVIVGHAMHHQAILEQRYFPLLS